ncbi:hypothetical protein GCM10027089_09610 [Nocardia thraciensis]
MAQNADWSQKDRLRGESAVRTRGASADRRDSRRDVIADLMLRTAPQISGRAPGTALGAARSAKSDPSAIRKRAGR